MGRRTRYPSATPNNDPDYATIRSLADLCAHLGDEAKALRLFEWLRWPEGRFCPACGSLGKHCHLEKRRLGLYACGDCGRRFSATEGTPSHATKLSLSVWIEAGFLVAASSKGVSSITLHKHLGISADTGPAREWGERFQRRETAFAVETPPVRETLAESRTMNGGGVAGVATIGAAGAEIARDVLTETQTAILPLVQYLDALRWMFIAVALGGIVVTICARLDDWKKGLR